MTDTSYKLYTAEQVRGIDYAAIHESGIAGYDLMSRAGQAVLEDAREWLPHAKHWLIICGGGNNGGDGYVVARLATELGIQLSVCSLVDPQSLNGDAALAYTDWQQAGGELTPWPISDDDSFDLALDALLGTGIDRGVEGRFLQAITLLNQLACPKYAIDIPSGLNADTGVVMGAAVNAQRCMTFVGRKRGMYTADGPDHCGHIKFDDLSIPNAIFKKFSEKSGELLSLDTLAGLLAPRPKNTHKGSFGHVFAIGGQAGMSGAIRLCGEAALRSGAGKVTLCTHPAHAALVNLSRPELMVKAVDSSDQLASILDKARLIAVGPGLGTDAWSESMFAACFNVNAHLVIDADALNLLTESRQAQTNSRGKWILTPHPAEAARLLGCNVSDIQNDRVGSAIILATKFNATVVLKGCGTVIAEPSGNYAICPLGNPGMATAGSGDVLTGVIAALLAQNLTCFEAAKVGVMAHAAAGDFAAEKHGEMALIAGDMIAGLSRVWKEAGT